VAEIQLDIAFKIGCISRKVNYVAYILGFIVALTSFREDPHQEAQSSVWKRNVAAVIS
jgi:hypothetical protein